MTTKGLILLTILLFTGCKTAETRIDEGSTHTIWTTLKFKFHVN